MPHPKTNPAMNMLKRVLDRLLPELTGEDLDALFTAVRLERARRRQLRHKNPELINT